MERRKYVGEPTSSWMDQIKPSHANEKPLPRGVCLASIVIIVGDLSRAQDELDLDSIPIFQDASRGELHDQ
eukprot:scaffold50939_cov59-Attheya_sp.AAC.3